MTKYFSLTGVDKANFFQECIQLLTDFYPVYVWEKADQAAEVAITLADQLTITVFGQTKTIAHPDRESKQLKRYFYQYLVEVSGKTLPWGILQGVRPTKLVRQLHEQLIRAGSTDELFIQDQIIKNLQQDYLVSDSAAEMAWQVYQQELPYIPTQQQQLSSCSVYVGIPFCPTICSYCSFGSHLAQADQVQSYVDCLVQEIDQTADLIGRKYSLNSLYIGGGTPTVLSVDQLEQILSVLEKHINLAALNEVTVEAGRVDTITESKLRCLKKYDVSRISINPQTMNQETLRAIGRPTTNQQLREVYRMAQKIGFDVVNMDIIVGLQGETVEHISNTIDGILELAPDQITVHSLARKRASRDNQDRWQYWQKQSRTYQVMDQMLALVKRRLAPHYKPYYLYRQKNIIGSNENIGYYKNDRPGLYNIDIMEEVRTIWGFGAGAVTKIILPNGKIKRMENLKNPNHYIGRFDEMIARKQEYLKSVEN